LLRLRNLRCSRLRSLVRGASLLFL
jgi:hypothetical protein